MALVRRRSDAEREACKAEHAADIKTKRVDEGFYFNCTHCNRGWVERTATSDEDPYFSDEGPSRHVAVTPVWTMRDGSRIKIRDMTLSHVLNTQNLLSRSKLQKQVQLQRHALRHAEGHTDERTLQRIVYSVAERVAKIERWQHLFNLELDRRGVSC